MTQLRMIPTWSLTSWTTIGLLVLAGAQALAATRLPDPRPAAPAAQELLSPSAATDRIPLATAHKLAAVRHRPSLRSQGDVRHLAAPFVDVDLTDEALSPDRTAGTADNIAGLTPHQYAVLDSLSRPFALRRDGLRGTNATPADLDRRATAANRDLPWTPDQLLANPTNMNDEYVSLAESPLTGWLYAVFAAKDLGGTDRDIHIARSQDAGVTWTVWEMPSFSEDEYQPELAVDAGGYIHVTWLREDGYIIRTRSDAADDPTVWAFIRGLPTDELCATPSIAVSGAGDFGTVFIAAGWLTVNWDLYAYEWTLIFMYSTNGGQTITYDYFLPDGYEDYWPDVTMDSGTVHLVNAEVDYYTGETEILIASDVYDGGFSDPASLSGWTSNNCGFPQITSQGDDVFIVYQHDYSDGLSVDGDIIYTYSWDGAATFYGPFGLVADEYESVGPAIFTRDGVVGCVWLDAPPNADEFYLAGRLAGGSGTSDAFGEVELVSEEPYVEPMFHSCFGAATDDKIHAVWVDRRDYPTQGHNIYTSRRDVQPNLTSFTPADWDTCLVASNTRGERTTTYLSARDTTYISFAFLNDGLADITETFHVALQLDGETVAEWSADGGLETGTYVPLEDFPLLIDEGEHDLAVLIDNEDDIAETDETDNTCGLTLTWVDGDPVLRLNPTHIIKDITPEKSRREAWQLVQDPVLRHEVHLPVIAPDLATAQQRAGDGQLLRVMITAADRIDPPGMALALQGATRATRRDVITAAVRSQSEKFLLELRPRLDRLVTAGRGREPELLWLTGTVFMEMDAAAVDELAGDPSVGRLWLDDQLSTTFGDGAVLQGTDRPAAAAGDRANAWHIGTVGADQAWAAGYTGAGLLVGHLDSGVAYDHPDLAGQMWDGGASYPHHGWDAVDDDDDPYDGDTSGYHGTHTSGLIIGDGTGGTATGIAPEATLMALRVLPGYMVDLVEGLQVGLDNGVHIFTLSGGWSVADDDTRAANRYNAELFLSIDIPWVCAAGNGDNAGSHYAAPLDISSPGDCPSSWYAPNGGQTAVFSVGALNSDTSYWSLSSYGPTEWDLDNTYGETDFHDYPYPSGLMKPDIAAPGGNVTSCYGLGGYVAYSGTSMSTPIVTGAFCLIWSALPQLLVPQVCELFETTATDLTASPATAGRDNYTGAGLLDIATALANLPTAESEPFWICNDGPLPLHVARINESASWLQIDMPTAAIAPGDSLQVLAQIDPAGLTEGIYHETVYVFSDDPTGPGELLVTLAYGQAYSAVDETPPPAVGTDLVNYPNPFNPRTVLHFTVDRAGTAELDIYDLRGRCVRRLLSGQMSAGSHEVVFDGRDDGGRALASGQYVARLSQAGQAPLTRKLVLVR